MELLWDVTFSVPYRIQTRLESGILVADSEIIL
jgi:hypothetical protein